MEAVRSVQTWNGPSRPPEERLSVKLERGGKPVPGIDPKRIFKVEESVMTWRKANHIHAWFVDNVQDGKDDCEDYLVEWDDLRVFLAKCEEVLKASELVDGMVYVGTLYDREHPKGLVQREPGKVIKDATVASTLLPTRAGFFFGSCEYDEDYLKDVQITRDWLVSMLKDHDAGVPGHIVYRSSW